VQRGARNKTAIVYGVGGGVAKTSSDRAAAIAGTIVNVTCGLLPG
jgi:hypothetical protein